MNIESSSRCSPLVTSKCLLDVQKDRTIVSKSSCCGSCCMCEPCHEFSPELAWIFSNHITITHWSWPASVQKAREWLSHSWANQAPWMPTMQVIFHLFQTLLRNKRMFLVDSSLFWQVQTVKLVVSGSSQNLVKGGAVGHDASHYDSSGTQLVLIDSAELRSRFYIYQYSMRIRVILNWGNADRYKTSDGCRRHW